MDQNLNVSTAQTHINSIISETTFVNYTQSNVYFWLSFENRKKESPRIYNIYIGHITKR